MRAKILIIVFLLAMCQASYALTETQIQERSLWIANQLGFAWSSCDIETVTYTNLGWPNCPDGKANMGSYNFYDWYGTAQIVHEIRNNLSPAKRVQIADYLVNNGYAVKTGGAYYFKVEVFTGGVLQDMILQATGYSGP